VKTLIPVAGGVVALAAAAALAMGVPKTIAFVSVTAGEKQGKNDFTQYSNDFQGKKQVGKDRLICSVQGGGTVFNCTDTVIRAGGTIKLSFTTRSTTTQGPLKVVGGTGTYKGATGTGTFKQLTRGGSKTLITLKLA
jgi:hypothetical protein